MYGSALAGYSRAAELDPGWKEPPEREKQLLEYLEKVTELLQNKVGDSLQKYRHTVCPVTKTYRKEVGENHAVIWSC